MASEIDPRCAGCTHRMDFHYQSVGHCLDGETVYSLSSEQEGWFPCKCSQYEKEEQDESAKYIWPSDAGKKAKSA